MWAIRALEAVKHICIVGLIILGFAGAIFGFLYLQPEMGAKSMTEQEEAEMLALTETLREWLPWIIVAIVVGGNVAVYTYRRVKGEPAGVQCPVDPNHPHLAIVPADACYPGCDCCTNCPWDYELPAPNGEWP